MTVEITERMKTVFKRDIELTFSDFVEAGEKIRHSPRLFEKELTSDNTFYSKLLYNDVYLVYNHSFTFYHENNDCEIEEEIVEYEHNCSCEKEVEYEIILSKDPNDYFSDNKYFKKTYTKNSTLDEVLEDFSNMPDIFKVCQCSKLAIKDGWCKTCFTFRSDHPTDEHCSICYENEGHYVQLDCNHYFHQHCYNTIEVCDFSRKRKCPLCREIGSIKKHTI